MSRDMIFIFRVNTPLTVSRGVARQEFCSSCTLIPLKGKPCQQRVARCRAGTIGLFLIVSRDRDARFFLVHDEKMYQMVVKYHKCS
jgi:hypothetical protein